MSDYIEIDIVTDSAGQKEVLIAQLADIGFEGFEEEPKKLKAFIPESRFDEEQLKTVLVPMNLSYSRSVIKPTNWNADWEASFEPVRVAGFCAIRASFHAPVPSVQHELVITPKMSFGTGHHATTYMMIAAMEGIDFREKAVLDFGTGTGVLAILAEKLGASAIDAIDNDDWSIENARENLQTNACRKIHLYKAGDLDGAGRYDTILANINKHIILEYLAEMKRHTVPRGIILLSGLLLDDFNDIMDKACQLNLQLTGKKERNSWLCMQLANGE